MSDFWINPIGEIGTPDANLMEESDLTKEQAQVLRQWEQLAAYTEGHSSVRAYGGINKQVPYRFLTVEFSCKPKDRAQCLATVKLFAGQFVGTVDDITDCDLSDAHHQWSVDIETIHLDRTALTTLFAQVWLHLQQNVALHRFIHHVL